MLEMPEVMYKQLGDCTIVAEYGYGCELHSSLLNRSMEMPMMALERFIADSLRQQIVLPGESDFLFVVPEGRLEVLFRHEGDIHVGGADEGLVDRFVASEPFCDLLHPTPPESPPRTAF